MIRRTSRTLLALIALLALGVFPWFFLTELPISALVAKKEQNVPMRVYGLGTVEARIVSDVGLEVGATLIELTVGSGDAVTAGQVLARLNPTEQEARVARAEARVASASSILPERQATNARQQELLRRSAISSQLPKRLGRMSRPPVSPWPKATSPSFGCNRSMPRPH
ncbi:MAG: biotin/lipoyl-binding protein [Paracoccaceae bacterium]